MANTPSTSPSNSENEQKMMGTFKTEPSLSNEAEIFKTTTPNEAFPLMDLPIELRQMIAEFTYYEEISWYWKTFTDERIIGAFRNGLSGSEFNPLSLVSKQLHQETLRSIPYKSHTLVFDATNIIRSLPKSEQPHRYDPFDSLQYVIKAWRHFQGYAPPSILEQVRHVRFICTVDYLRPMNRTPLFLSWLLQLSQIARELPNARFELCPDWDVPVHHSFFYKEGRAIQKLLEESPFNDPNRTWRVRTVKPDPCFIAVLEACIPTEELEEVLSWVRDGL